VGKEGCHAQAVAGDAIGICGSGGTP
jgi:hypothetical protein